MKEDIAFLLSVTENGYIIQQNFNKMNEQEKLNFLAQHVFDVELPKERDIYQRVKDIQTKYQYDIRFDLFDLYFNMLNDVDQPEIVQSYEILKNQDLTKKFIIACNENLYDEELIDRLKIENKRLKKFFKNKTNGDIAQLSYFMNLIVFDHTGAMNFLKDNLLLLKNEKHYHNIYEILSQLDDKTPLGQFHQFDLSQGVDVSTKKTESFYCEIELKNIYAHQESQKMLKCIMKTLKDSLHVKMYVVNSSGIEMVLEKEENLDLLKKIIQESFHKKIWLESDMSHVVKIIHEKYLIEAGLNIQDDIHHKMKNIKL